jgi:3-deoxy-manno-octulosonate cytidylyltransferase (CMP-KDO synthetase)
MVMRIIGVIPARWQSSRFPGKPLAHILGKSLILRTYENSLRCKFLDEVVIATDDKRIYDHAQEFGAKVFMTSPSCPTGTDRVWEVVAQNFGEAEIIVNVQGDEPCLSPLVVDILVQKILETPSALLTTPVAKITEPQAISSPSTVKCVFDREGRALYFSRSPIPFVRNGKGTYYRHLGVYCFRKTFMQEYVRLEKTSLQENEDLEQLKILESGYPIHVCVVEDQATGVDTPEDLKTVEKFLWQNESMFL